MKNPICISGSKYRKIEKRVIRGGSKTVTHPCSANRLWEVPFNMDYILASSGLAGHDDIVFRVVRNR